MISRYTRPEMAAIWSAESRFRVWFLIEAHAATAMANLVVIPESAAQAIWERGREANFDTERIEQIEAEVKHDVIAFLTHLAEHVGVLIHDREGLFPVLTRHPVRESNRDVIPWRGRVRF